MSEGTDEDSARSLRGKRRILLVLIVAAGFAGIDLPSDMMFHSSGPSAFWLSSTETCPVLRVNGSTLSRAEML